MRGIKGANCITTRTVIREIVGNDRYDAFVRTLPSEQQILATRRVFPVEWIDYDLWMALEDRFYSDLFDNDYQRYRDLCRRIAEVDFNTLYRALIKLGSPGFIVERAAQAYGRITNVGTMRCVTLVKKPTRAEPTIVRLEGVPNRPAIISGIHGGIDGVLALSRAHNPEVWVISSGGPKDACTVDFGAVY